MRCGLLISTLFLPNGLALATTPPPVPLFVRTQYAHHWATFQTQCPPPQQLAVSTVRQDQPALQFASFACWRPPDAQGDRTGHWLGRLPYPHSARQFAPALTCASADQPCQTTLAQIKAQFPTQLRQAEFVCAMQNGTLFLVPPTPPTPLTIELRCGFSDTRLFVRAGERLQDAWESFTSVDISVGRWQLQPPQP